MGEMYWITGAQLGILKSKHLSRGTKDRLIDDIIENQFISNYPNDEDKERFKKQIAELT